MSYEPPKNGFRTFVIVWITQGISVIGTSLTLFAINIWLATVAFPRPDQQAQLAGALSAFNLSFAIPTMLIVPFAGAWADRHDRKRTMIVTDLISAVGTLGLVALMASGGLRFPILLVLAVIFAVVGAFHASAFDTSYAMLVSDKQLARANGMMQTLWALSNIIAPALAAFLISLPALARQGHMPGFISGWLGGLSDGTPLAVTLDSMSFFLAAAILPFLHIPSPKRADLNAAGKPKKSMWADIREGALYIWRRRPMLWLLGTFAVVNLCSPFGVLFPLIVKFQLAADWSARGYTLETAMALINSLSSVGGVAAGFIISAWGGLKQRRIYGVVVPLLAAGLFQTALGFSSWLYMAAALSLLLSASFPFANTHSQAIWQSQVPRELQGRVFSVRRVIAQGSGPIGMAMAGLLAGRMSPGVVLTTLGGLVVLFCTMQLLNPYLLRVENKEYLDHMAAQAAASDD